MIRVEHVGFVEADATQRIKHLVQIRGVKGTTTHNLTELHSTQAWAVWINELQNQPPGSKQGVQETAIHNPDPFSHDLFSQSPGAFAVTECLKNS